MSRPRRAWLLAVLLVTACAGPRSAAVPAPALEPRTDPGARPPSKPPPPRAGPGYFPLPDALHVDPTKLAILPLELEVKRPQVHTLTNGTRVYLMVDPTAPVVELRAMFHSGSVDEPAPLLGLADVTMGLLVTGGAGKLGPNELDELLDFHAVNAGADAGEELSTLSLNLRSVDLPRFLPVFADLVLRPRFDPARLKLSIERRLAGLKRRPDSPDGLAIRALRKAVYGPTSPLAREPTRATLQRIGRQDVVRFHAAALARGGLRLLVTGDFDPAPLLAELERELGQVQVAPARTPTPIPPSPALERRVILVPKDTAQAKVRVGGRGYERHSPIEHPARVMSVAVGGSLGAGRLFRILRDQLGLAYSAYATVQPGPTTGLFYAGVDTAPDRVAATLERLLAILEGTRESEPIGPEELARAKDIFLNTFAFRFDRADKIVREKAVYDALGYPEDYLDTYRERIAAVTPASAHEAARRVIVPGELQIVVVGPERLAEPLARFGPVTIVRDVEAFR